MKDLRNEAEWQMSKIIKGKWSSPLALTLVAIIFSATALLVPWWSVNISSEASSLLDSTMKTDYYIQQTVTAVKIVNNNTETQSIALSNLTEDTGDLSFWLIVTYIASVAGLGLSCLMLVLIVLSVFGRTFNGFLPFVGYIAAILLFIAPILLSSNFSAAVSKFSRLTPVSVSPTWTPMSPSQITGFWGSIEIQTSPDLPEWAKGGNFWVWGADAGWYLTFAAALLVSASSLLTRTIIKKKVEWWDEK
jgi:hypothetical protein